MDRKAEGQIILRQLAEKLLFAAQLASCPPPDNPIDRNPFQAFAVCARK